MIKAYIQAMIKADNAYGGEGMMLALYFVALLIIIFYSKKDRKQIVIPQVILIIFLYMGIPFVDVFVRGMEFFDGRFFWLIMTPVITSIGLTLFIFGIENTKMYKYIIIVLIPIIFYCGKYAISDDMYKKATNLYRLPQATVDITEYVLSNYDEPCIIVPYTISHPFRQISTRVHPLFGEDASSGRIFDAVEEMWVISDQMERTIPDLNLIEELITDYDVDYILFDTVYTELCEAGNINIYNYPIDKRYVGDRTPTVTYDDLLPITVVDDEDPHWDLSEYKLKYCGRFEQYVLYEFEE